MKTCKILMFGDRYWNDERTIKAVFDRMPSNVEYTIIHGACSGADSFCGIVAHEMGHKVIEYPADWNQFKKAAGIIRNMKMLDENPDIKLCIGFHNDISSSRGSKHMHEYAQQKNHKSLIVESMWPIIDSFSGDFRFLSNFFPSEIKVSDRIFPTVEHAYQSLKTFDVRESQYVSNAKTASEAKRRGKQITVRPDWNDVKLDIMNDLIRQKFLLPALRDMLISTGDVTLIEGNYWKDEFWGVCRGIGKNYLGKILMQVRSEL